MKKRTINFEELNANSAGIDIGSEKIFVSVDGESVVNFGTFSSDYERCGEYLQAHAIERVAMEATGVYWISLYRSLEESGIRVSLVNPKQTLPKRGDKTDVKDARRIQKLFSAGLLKESFIPEGRLFEIRMLVRERLDIIEMGGVYVQKMQRSLELMNIKLTEVLSQIHGASGLRMIRAIIEGERSPQVLLSLCDERIRTKKSELVLKALEGSYQDTYIFMLQQNMELWEKHQQQIQQIDARISTLLLDLTQHKEEPQNPGKEKPIRHHKPTIDHLQVIMHKLFGVNMSSISGINNYTLLRLVGETGTDMSRFPTAKQFVSWCGLAPANHQSGKRSKWIKSAPCNKAGQTFKEVAQALDASKDKAIGCFIRKIKSRRGPAVAYKAGARKIAEAFYYTLLKGVEYIEQGVGKYKEKLEANELKIIRKLAQKHNFQLVEN